MKTKIFITFLATICISTAFAQYNLNNYKYIIVEKQFHFQNDPGQYNLNNLTKFEFEKLGFTVIMQDQELPEDLKSNYCLALNSEVKVKGVLRTRATIILKNCDAEVVYTSGEGVTKEKDFDRTFGIAIRKAFETMKGISYNYVPNEKITSIGKNTEDVKNAEAKIEALQAEIKELKQDDEKKETVEQMEKVVQPTEKVSDEADTNMYLYAQNTSAGYEVVDEAKKVVMLLHKTALKDVFIVKDKNAIVYKKDGVWYYSEKEAEPKALELKF